MKRLTLCVILLLLIQATTALAFDSRRKGFVLGAGLGFGPVARVSSNGPSGDSDNSGLAINTLIGYALSETDMIVLLGDNVVYSIVGETFVQSFDGLSWFHYFGQQGKSLYVAGGVGLQNWHSYESDTKSSAGLGLMIGGGFEFARHIQIHGSLSFGETSTPVVDYSHSQVVITVSAIAF